MGWTSQNADFYKNGKVDRKAECDKLMNSDMVAGQSNAKIGEFKVLKSAMVGSVYYAAVRRMRYAADTEPEQTIVFAVICLTSVKMKEYFNFAYKDMDESEGPYQCQCPKGILDLLTPTDNEYANHWRQNCRENLMRKKLNTSLNKLPVGAKIEWTVPCELEHGGKKGDKKTLYKRAAWGKQRPYWCDGYYRYSTKLIGTSYTVIKEDA